jgi:hypothetical protein
MFTTVPEYLSTCNTLLNYFLIIHYKKKVSDIPVPRGACHLPNSPWAEIISFFPPRQSLISDIPAGDVNVANLFLQCIYVHCDDFSPYSTPPGGGSYGGQRRGGSYHHHPSPSEIKISKNRENRRAAQLVG